MRSSKVRYGAAGFAFVAVALVAAMALAKVIGATGKIKFDQPTPCGPDECYTFTGSLSGYGLSGSGMIDEASCTTVGRRMCCKNSGTAKAADVKGDSLTFNYSANGCERTPKRETLRGPIDIVGGAGRFAGATGKGSMAVLLNPETGKGSIAIQANLK